MKCGLKDRTAEIAYINKLKIKTNQNNQKQDP